MEGYNYELELVYLSPYELTPYENNTRKHAPRDIEQIKESIMADGFNDPIGIWGKQNIIVEGHGRQIAALESLPCTDTFVEIIGKNSVPEIFDRQFAGAGITVNVIDPVFAAVKSLEKVVCTFFENPVRCKVPAAEQIFFTAFQKSFRQGVKIFVPCHDMVKPGTTFEPGGMRNFFSPVCFNIFKIVPQIRCGFITHSGVVPVIKDFVFVLKGIPKQFERDIGKGTVAHDFFMSDTGNAQREIFSVEVTDTHFISFAQTLSYVMAEHTGQSKGI